MMNSVDEQNHQLLHICKICKKVYKDRTGLMDHQRLQHPQPKISVSQQVQQLAMNMNRFNNRKNNVSIIRNYTPGREDGGGVRILRVDQSCPTLQKPPAYLKPKLQSRTIHQGGGSAGRIDDHAKNVFDYDDGDPDECKNGEVDKDDTESSPTIITASMAESTAACYNPDGSSNTLGRTAPIPSTSPRVSGGPSNKSIPGRIQIPQLKVIGGGAAAVRNQKLNPNLTRFHQKLSANAAAPPPLPANIGGIPSPGSKAVPQGMQSPNKLAGNRAPVPKLMSKTKAQFQILKSQATRPKIVPRNATNNALPKAVVPPAASSPTPGQSAVGKVPVGTNNGVGNPASNHTVQKSNQQGDLSMEEDKASNPPKLHPEKPQPAKAVVNSKTNSPTKKKGLPVVTQKPAQETKKPAVNNSNAKKVVEKPAVLRRESLNTPSGSGSDDDSNSEESSSVSSEDEDEEGPPPPKKATLGRNRPAPKPVVAKKSPAKPSPAKPSPAASSSVAKKSPAGAPKPFYPSKKYDDNGELRIFGKDYRCPDMDKVASYLNKKGIRVWICLVCEEPEEEISQGPMICCDSCEDWYHFICVGVDDEPPEDEKWFCKRCIYKNIQKKLDPKPSKSKSKPGAGTGSPKGKGGRGGGGGRGRGRGGSRGRGRR